MAKKEVASHWLVKSEPECFSIQDLAASPRQTTSWNGVRNYQARNLLREMQLDDRVLFYHSSVDPPCVVGVARVVRTAYPDASAWDPRDEHFDPKASPENPVWLVVDLKLDETFPTPLSLQLLRTLPELKNMELLRKGSRLSVQRVGKAEFAAICSLARAPASNDAKGPGNRSAKTATKGRGRSLQSPRRKK
jgi:predicted RNA-binding protein with PUA-like domain